MGSLCDLHNHSIYSDGTFAPRQLLAEADRIGLASIALTDHNSVAGLPEFLAAAGDYHVEAIPGIEFSTEWQDIELHVLALFVAPSHFGDITEKMTRFRMDKEQSNLDLIAALNQAGYPIDYEVIKASTGGYINRAHIAAELTRLGITPSIQEAFKTLLSDANGYYHPPKRMSPFESIEYIRSIGAVSVLAHPCLNLKEDQLRQFLSQAAPAGLDAMEVRYGRYSPVATKLSEDLVVEFGLLPSGGSDFHGSNKPDISMGRGLGNLEIPNSWMEALKARSHPAE